MHRIHFLSLVVGVDLVYVLGLPWHRSYWVMLKSISMDADAMKQSDDCCSDAIYRQNTVFFKNMKISKLSFYWKNCKEGYMRLRFTCSFRWIACMLHDAVTAISEVALLMPFLKFNIALKKQPDPLLKI